MITQLKLFNLCVFNINKANNKKKIKEIVCRNLEDKGKAKKLVEDYDSRYGKVRLCEVTLFFQCLNNWICLQKSGFPRERQVVKYMASRKTSDFMILK